MSCSYIQGISIPTRWNLIKQFSFTHTVCIDWDRVAVAGISLPWHQVIKPMRFTRRPTVIKCSWSTNHGDRNARWSNDNSAYKNSCKIIGRGTVGSDCVDSDMALWVGMACLHTITLTLFPTQTSTGYSTLSFVCTVNIFRFSLERGSWQMLTANAVVIPQKWSRNEDYYISVRVMFVLFIDNLSLADRRIN